MSMERISPNQAAVGPESRVLDAVSHKSRSGYPLAHQAALKKYLVDTTDDSDQASDVVELASVRSGPVSSRTRSKCEDDDGDDETGQADLEEELSDGDDNDDPDDDEDIRSRPPLSTNGAQRGAGLKGINFNEEQKNNNAVSVDQDETDYESSLSDVEHSDTEYMALRRSWGSEIEESHALKDDDWQVCDPEISIKTQRRRVPDTTSDKMQSDIIQSVMQPKGVQIRKKKSRRIKDSQVMGKSEECFPPAKYGPTVMSAAAVGEQAVSRVSRKHAISRTKAAERPPAHASARRTPDYDRRSAAAAEQYDCQRAKRTDKFTASKRQPLSLIQQSAVDKTIPRTKFNDKEVERRYQLADVVEGKLRKNSRSNRYQRTRFDDSSDENSKSKLYHQRSTRYKDECYNESDSDMNKASESDRGRIRRVKNKIIRLRHKGSRESSEENRDFSDFEQKASRGSKDRDRCHKKNKHECRCYSSSRSSSRKKGDRKSKGHMKPEKYDGNSCFETFLVQFNNCSQFNEWTNTEKLHYLRWSMTGTAAKMLWGTEEMNYKQLVDRLRSRFGDLDMEEKYQAEIQCRRRRPNESLRELAQNIRRLMMLAYPGDHTVTSERLAREHFLNALDDPSFELRVREKEPQTLDAALKVAQRLEVFRNAVKQRRQRMSRHVAESSASVSSSLERRVAKIEHDIFKPQERFEGQTRQTKHVTDNDKPPELKKKGKKEIKGRSVQLRLIMTIRGKMNC